MSGTLPLLDGFDNPQSVFAWRRGKPISQARFLRDVAALAARLPASGHVLNVCADRYRFAVGLAAALVRNQISLLPPSTHAATIQQLLARFPDTYCLTETAQPDIDLPQTLNDDRIDDNRDARLDDQFAMPRLPIDQTVAYVFTSGSTGMPTLHRKRWGSLVINVRSEAERLGCDRASRHAPLAIVATVPPQHMFGFESSLLMAWQSGNTIVAERPFYPADITSALARLPSPRMLVTTPFHLRALLAEDGDLPAIDQLLCATAPLSPALALEAERRFAAPLREIYGCTETGQLASRRPTVDPRWHLLGTITLSVEGDVATAEGGHIEQPTAVSDLIELASDFATSRRFVLAGRAADLVNIAGKRTSLGHLNLQLNMIEGVIDGVFVMPADDDAKHDGVTRLACVVVAPTLDASRLSAALRARIDAVFLPRPIHFVDRIPRNDTGKLTQATLQTMIASLHARIASRDEPTHCTDGKSSS
jgi:acyl-coenzyme A synthetase/AMP-(fatty) acid ligase